MDQAQAIAAGLQRRRYIAAMLAQQRLGGKHRAEAGDGDMRFERRAITVWRAWAWQSVMQGRAMRGGLRIGQQIDEMRIFAAARHRKNLQPVEMRGESWRHRRQPFRSRRGILWRHGIGGKQQGHMGRHGLMLRIVLGADGIKPACGILGPGEGEDDGDLHGRSLQPAMRYA